MPRMGRPRRASYDHRIASVADNIAGQEGLSFYEAMTEILKGNDFPVSDRSVRRRFGDIWDRDGLNLLMQARERAFAKTMKDIKSRIDLALMKEAMALASLARKDLTLFEKTLISVRSLFHTPATPADYDLNPFYRASMQYGDFQWASTIKQCGV